MDLLRVFLFEKIRMEQRDLVLPDIDLGKPMELFCYVLLNRGSLCHRDVLAQILWPDAPASHSRRYLSKALWQLQGILENRSAADHLLAVDPEWISLDPHAAFWLDVAQFEEAFNRCCGTSGWLLDSNLVHTLEDAAALYQGELLQGWYQEWCLFERERLRQMYMLLLDKLMEYYEAHGYYERGITCGLRILQQDLARERTHRRLMRIYLLAGDRTEALHQYERCKLALKQELNVEPSNLTNLLYERAKMKTPFQGLPDRSDIIRDSHLPKTTGIPARLSKIQALLDANQRQIQEEIAIIMAMLNN